MSKILFVGELSWNVVIDLDGAPRKTCIGGAIARAATKTADAGPETLMASDAAADAIGDLVVNTVAAHGVDMNSVDRFTEGRTPIEIHFDNGAPTVRYQSYPDEAFDIIWPRLEKEDTVVFGGHYTLDSRIRPRLYRLLLHAAEKGCNMVYAPLFSIAREPQITRVMPAILENCEISHTIVTRTSDLQAIYGTADSDKCYHDNIAFYGCRLINFDPDNSTISIIDRQKGKHQCNAGKADIATIIATAAMAINTGNSIAGAIAADIV